MKPDYLTLTNGREVRCEWNMNSLERFTTLTGIEVTELAKEKTNVGTLRTIAWCCAVEGEEADGKQLGLNEIEFGRLIDMAGVVKFSEILTRQTNGTAQKKSEPGRSPMMFFRKKT